jgi:hypothetical protein
MLQTVPVINKSVVKAAGKYRQSVVMVNKSGKWFVVSGACKYGTLFAIFCGEKARNRTPDGK